MRLPRFRWSTRAGVERGATAVEYAVLIAIIGITSIPVISLVGGNLADVITSAGNAIGGQATEVVSEDPNCTGDALQNRFHSVYINMENLSSARVEVGDPTWVSDLTACGYSFAMSADKTYDYYIGYGVFDGAGQQFNGGQDFKGRVAQYRCTYDNPRADGSGIQFDEHCTQLFEPNEAWMLAQMNHNYDESHPGWTMTVALNQQRPSEAHPTFRLLNGADTVASWDNYVWWY